LKGITTEAQDKILALGKLNQQDLMFTFRNCVGGEMLFFISQYV